MEDATLSHVAIKTRLSHFIPPPDTFHQGLFEIIDKWLEGLNTNYKTVVFAKDRQNREAHFFKCCIARALHCSVFKSKKLISDVLIKDHNKITEYIYNDYYRLFWNRNMTEKEEDDSYGKWDIYHELLHSIEQYCADQILPFDNLKPTDQ